MGQLPKGPWAEWYRGVVRKGLAGASLVVAPSRWMLQSLEELLWQAAEVAGDLQRADAGAVRPDGEERELCGQRGRLWDEGKQLRLLTEMEAAAACRFGWPARRRLRARARGLNPKARAGRAVGGRAFRGGDAGAARAGLRFTLRPRGTSRSGWRRWRPRCRAAQLWPTIFPACARCGRTRPVLPQG